MADLIGLIAGVLIALAWRWRQARKEAREWAAFVPLPDGRRIPVAAPGGPAWRAHCEAHAAAQAGSTIQTPPGFMQR